MGKRSNASKFPVARIKKMMQADEDIGKVAQATPVVISKALELFLADIVSAAAKESQSKGSRKVTAYHLKRAVYTTPTLDFLKDKVAYVPDPVGAEPLPDSASAPVPAPLAETSSSSSGKRAVEGEDSKDGASAAPVTSKAASPPAPASSSAKRVKRE